MSRTRRFATAMMLAVVLVSALLAHLTFFLDTPLWLQSWAALLLTGWLPATLLLTLLLPVPNRDAVSLGERALYVIGTGYGVSVVVMLGLSYLPGPIAAWMAFATFDLLLVALGAALWWRAAQLAPARPLSPAIAAVAPNQRIWLLIACLTIAVVGGLLRFPSLGYAEFQGDEARAMLRAAEVIEGFDGSLFEHRKGPTEILLPAVPYVLSGRIDEAAARLPFAFANFCALFGLFLLGWRWFGPLAGWVAAMFLALDGYLIAFSRIVQYQSIIFLTVVLVLLLLQRLALLAAARTAQLGLHSTQVSEAVQLENAPMQSGDNSNNLGLAGHFTVAAFLLATGLLSHYEAILVVVPALFVLWQIWRNGVGLGRLAVAFLPAILVGGGLLAAFYIPFVRYPTFGNTFEYLAYKRIGEELTYNNLADYFIRSTLYSSTYAFGLMTLLAVVGLIVRYRRGLGKGGWLVGGLVVAGVLLSFGWPRWLTIGGQDFTWAFFVAALGVGLLMPDRVAGERTAWLWFGAVLVLSIFFTATPNTHVYNFYFGWALVCGLVVTQGWQWLQDGAKRSAAARGKKTEVFTTWERLQSLRRVSSWLAVPVALALIVLFGYYQYSLFIRNDVEVLRTWPQNRPQGYWTAYTMPIESSIFGFPHRNGWKTVSVLTDQGVIDGAFDTNTKDWIVDWYTRGLGSCPRDHRYFVLADMVEPAKAAERAAQQAALEEGYELLGVVDVQGQERLHIYEKQPDIGVLALPAVRTFDSDEQAAFFDAILSIPQLAQSGRVVEPTIAHPLQFRLGETLMLIGYTLENQETHPGGEVTVTLYWQVLKPLPERYTVFTQLINRADARKAGQRDGEPVCGKLLTVDWQPGDVIADPYHIPIDPTTPFGTYALLIGMYPTDPNSRSGNLTFYNTEGQPLGESLSIDEVYVAPSAQQQAQRQPRAPKATP